GVAREEFQLVGHQCLALVGVAGAGGFEPPNTGSKVPRLTAWPRPFIPASLSSPPAARQDPSASAPPSTPTIPAPRAPGSAAPARTSARRRRPSDHCPT